jgi:hypothetical protein
VPKRLQATQICACIPRSPGSREGSGS